jgi:non-specific serine/threonine protein kinase
MALVTFESRLPDEPTRLVDERSEIAEVIRLLGENRFVTVTGAPGVGKTRVGVRIGHELLRAFHAGVWFVGLADVVESEAIPLEVANVIGLVPDQVARVAQGIGVLLGGREALLILDNCEHLIEGVAGFVADLLAMAPSIRVLATSRESVGLYGEHVHVLRPIPTQAGRQDLAAGGVSYAAELFIVRAEATGHLHRSQLDSSDLAAITQLCATLDGIPLAIELAAAQVPLMHPSEILARLVDMVDVLRVDQRGSTPRHRSIEAALTWSFRLCTTQEQLLWLRASVFRGGFDAEAATAVCSGDGLQPAEVGVAIRGLIAKSVLTPGYVAGAARYRMLEPIRAYGAAHLSDAERESLYLERHRQWASALVGESEARYFGPHQFEVLTRLHADHHNIAAAVERILEGPADPLAVYRLVVPLAIQRWARGFERSVPRWIHQAVGQPQPPTAARAVALAKLAILGRAFTDDPDELDALLARAQRDLDLDPDEDARAWVDAARATLLRGRGDGEAALRTVEDALGRRDGRPDELTAMLLVLGAGIASRFGTLDDTAAWYERLRSTLGPTGEFGFQNAGLEILCSSAARAGDHAQVREIATKILGRLGDNVVPVNVAVVVSALALAAFDADDLERAVALTAASHRLLTDAHAEIWEATSYGVHSDCVRRCVEIVGGDRFEEAVAAAGTTSAAEVIELALGPPSRGRGAPASRRPATHRMPAGSGVTLTRREHEVAALVAEGLTDREIASRLVVSIRTAQGHVGQCLSKLHLTSRTQLALWVREQEVGDAR